MSSPVFSLDAGHVQDAADAVHAEPRRGAERVRFQVLGQATGHGDAVVPAEGGAVRPQEVSLDLQGQRVLGEIVPGPLAFSQTMSMCPWMITAGECSYPLVPGFRMMTFRALS